MWQFCEVWSCKLGDMIFRSCIFFHWHLEFKNLNVNLLVGIVCVLDALKFTMFLRRSKFDISQNDFDNIVVEDVKYLLSTSDRILVF